MKIISKKHRSTRYIIIGIVAVIMLAAGYLLYKHFTPKPVDGSGIYNKSTLNPDPNVPVTKKESAGVNNSKDQGDNQEGPSIDPQTTPTAPIGTFISNHRPNLSGSPAPSQETSTCTTTPGAECRIEFTKDGVTKVLPAKKTDQNGNVNWSNWNIQDIGLTAGTWKVTVIASNGSLNSSTVDATDLVVSP